MHPPLVTPPIRAIILDLGNVLLEWSMDASLLEGVPLQSMMKTKTWLDHQCGLISTETCYENLGGAFGLPATKIAETLDRLRGTLKTNQRLVRLIRHLKRARPDLLVIAMSNISTPDIDYVRGAVAADMTIFDRVFASAEARMLKPDLGFYRFVIEQVGGQAGQFVFVDDKQANVNSAVETGMHGVRFTSMEDIEREITTVFGLNNTAL